jgi:hypothetical protein
MPLRRFCNLLWLFATLSAFGSDVALKWDASETSTVTGYKVYCGTAPGVYGTPTAIPNQTAWIVKDLNKGTYYFVVTAFDADGNESDPSNEVSITVPDESAPSQPLQDFKLNNLKKE